MRRGLFGGAALSVAVILLAPIPISGGPGVGSPDHPSIVVILTDDQRWDTLWAMPTVQKELVHHGVTFTNAFVVNSLCCPSRASILTGQYSHSTGVYTNGPPHGGFGAFKHHEHSTIATWLQGAGYRTALIGKYMNHYTLAGEAGYVPPGWNRWVAFALTIGHYYDYPMNMDGTVKRFDHSPADYSTNELAREAVKFIRRANGPLFLYWASATPHAPATPAQQDVGKFSNLEPWRPPNYDEEDVSDKPAWVRSLPRLTPERKASIDAFREKQYESLLALDGAVGRIVEALRETNRLSTTMIVLTTDNGLGWGEHRWNQKKDAYEESIRVPMVVRYDPLVTGQRSDSHLALNIDLAPTFAEIAGVTARDADGKSLVPLLTSPDSTWRTDFLIEHLKDPDAPIPTYCAVRNERYLYVAYGTGEEELYDLQSDPYELSNIASDPTALPTLLLLRQRDKELCKPLPPGFTFPY